MGRNREFSAQLRYLFAKSGLKLLNQDHCLFFVFTGNDGVRHFLNSIFNGHEEAN